MERYIPNNKDNISTPLTLRLYNYSPVSGVTSVHRLSPGFESRQTELSVLNRMSEWSNHVKRDPRNPGGTQVNPGKTGISPPGCLPNPETPVVCEINPVGTKLEKRLDTENLY